MSERPQDSRTIMTGVDSAFLHSVTSVRVLKCREKRQTTLLLQEDRKRRKKVTDFISENVHDLHEGAGAGDDDLDDEGDPSDTRKFLGAFSQELQRTSESERMYVFCGRIFVHLMLLLHVFSVSGDFLVLIDPSEVGPTQLTKIESPLTQVPHNLLYASSCVLEHVSRHFIVCFKKWSAYVANLLQLLHKPRFQLPISKQQHLNVIARAWCERRILYLWCS